jgi:hypothetical protein
MNTLRRAVVGFFVGTTCVLLELSKENLIVTNNLDGSVNFYYPFPRGSGKKAES